MVTIRPTSKDEPRTTDTLTNWTASRLDSMPIVYIASPKDVSFDQETQISVNLQVPCIAMAILAQIHCHLDFETVVAAFWCAGTTSQPQALQALVVPEEPEVDCKSTPRCDTFFTI